MILRDVYAEINLGAIRHNFTEIRRQINPASKLCAVVKANAYGHGAIEVSKVAVECGADFLAVATVEEGLELRRAGFELPILILSLIPTSAAGVVVENDLTATVADFDCAEKISVAAVKLNRLAKVHLKIETGMGRIGIAPDKAVALAEKISKTGINVKADKPISLYASNYSDASYDATNVLPLNVLTGNYIIQTYEVSREEAGYAKEFAVVATEISHLAEQTKK